MKTKRSRAKPVDSSAKVAGNAKGARRASAVPDVEIDTSDIPPLTDEFFRNAVRNPFYRAVKQSTTVRIDADVLAWLKSFGRGYQTRINSLLRAAMEGAAAARSRK